MQDLVRDVQDLVGLVSDVWGVVGFVPTVQGLVGFVPTVQGLVGFVPTANGRVGFVPACWCWWIVHWDYLGERDKAISCAIINYSPIQPCTCTHTSCN